VRDAPRLIPVLVPIDGHGSSTKSILAWTDSSRAASHGGRRRFIGLVRLCDSGPVHGKSIDTQDHRRGRVFSIASRGKHQPAFFIKTGMYQILTREHGPAASHIIWKQPLPLRPFFAP
jgi:hypothetical protein